MKERLAAASDSLGAELSIARLADDAYKYRLDNVVVGIFALEVNSLGENSCSSVLPFAAN